jgi:DNA-binding FadR family transcriptional regulator
MPAGDVTGDSHAAAAPPAGADPLRPATNARLLRLGAVDELMARIAVSVQLRLMEPGERLPPVADIASTFGVSTITVRRALTGLAARGIVVSRRGRNGGTFVADDPDTSQIAEFSAYRVDSGEAHELLDQRLVLECGSAYLAAQRAQPADLDRLDGLVDGMHRATTWAEFRAIDPKFHWELAVIAGSSRAAEDLLAILSRLLALYVPYPIEFLRESNEDHRQLVAALRRRDGSEAAAVARRHIEAIHGTVFVGSSAGHLKRSA